MYKIMDPSAAEIEAVTLIHQALDLVVSDRYPRSNDDG